MVSSDESGLLRDIERVLRRSIPTVPTPVFKIVESAQPAPNSQRGSGDRPYADRPQGERSGNRPGQGRHHGGGHGGGGGRDSRRAPTTGSSAGMPATGSGTRSFGQQQRGRFR